LKGREHNLYLSRENVKEFGSFKKKIATGALSPYFCLEHGSEGRSSSSLLISMKKCKLI
jgi:hypothetical protein